MKKRIITIAFLALVALFTTSCGKQPVCGDGIVEGDETCDISATGAQKCVGALECAAKPAPQDFKWVWSRKDPTNKCTSTCEKQKATCNPVSDGVCPTGCVIDKKDPKFDYDCRQIGDPCTRDSDCKTQSIARYKPNSRDFNFPASGCLQSTSLQEGVYQNGYCSLGCFDKTMGGTGGECPEGTACYQNKLCLKKCKSSSECRQSDGYECDPIANVCVSVEKSTCNSPSDCQSTPNPVCEELRLYCIQNPTQPPCNKQPKQSLDDYEKQLKKLVEDCEKPYQMTCTDAFNPTGIKHCKPETKPGATVAKGDVCQNDSDCKGVYAACLKLPNNTNGVCTVKCDERNLARNIGTNETCYFPPDANTLIPGQGYVVSTCSNASPTCASNNTSCIADPTNPSQNLCLPVPPSVGKKCASPAECPDYKSLTKICVTAPLHAMCSFECNTTDKACPEGSVCVHAIKDVCVKSCLTGDACPAGFTQSGAHPASNPSDNVCVCYPNA